MAATGDSAVDPLSDPLSQTGLRVDPLSDPLNQTGLAVTRFPTRSGKQVRGTVLCSSLRRVLEVRSKSGLE